MKSLLVAAVTSVALACPMAHAVELEESVQVQSLAAQEESSMPAAAHKRGHHKGHAVKGGHHKPKGHPHKHKRHGAKRHRHMHKKHMDKPHHGHIRVDDGKRQHGEQPERESAVERKIEKETELNNR